jgi:DNA-binding PadR family transcriptional regulator
MANKDETSRYLPLTEATFYIMLALVEPLHGYGVMQMVEALSEGKVEPGPGTLYGVLTSLEREKLIAMLREEERRKVYQLTPRGREVLRAQIERLEVMVKNGQSILRRL